MGLMLLLDRITDSGISRSLVLWLLLAGALGLTLWECRERGYRLKVLLWWMSVVFLTHVVGYIALRLTSPRGEKPDR